jgi:hypothetical protein
MRVTSSTHGRDFLPVVCRPAGDNLYLCPRVTTDTNTLTRRVGYPRISAPAGRIAMPRNDGSLGPLDGIGCRLIFFLFTNY